jgi:catechol 2,3-dioxygenase-like lactoylglutathione lyase family enzyme
MKVPPHLWDRTVAFYETVLGFQVIEATSQSVAFAFGANTLWIDRVDQLSQAELWLELVVTDLDRAADKLEAARVARRDEIEPLPEGVNGFWIENPASIIHLVVREES